MSPKAADAPGCLENPQARRQTEGNASQSSALISVRNSISESPKFYDALQLEMRERRPRLLPEGVDTALVRLIHRGQVRLDSELRWAARWL